MEFPNEMISEFLDEWMHWFASCETNSVDF